MQVVKIISDPLITIGVYSSILLFKKKKKNYQKSITRTYHSVTEMETSKYRLTLRTINKSYKKKDQQRETNR